MKGLTKINRFIKENDLDFSGTGSELNGNCVILAGYLYYIIEESKEILDAYDIIEALKISADAAKELHRVFDYVQFEGYDKFWRTAEARDKYTF